MAESMKAIKSRIKSVENTRQITKAMELVATGKLRRAKERIEHSRPFFEILKKTLDDIERENRDFSSPFTRKAENKRTCRIVIAGDRGLAGGYNSNLFKAAAAQPGDLILPIGRKAVELYRRKGFEILSEEYAVADDVSVGNCGAMGEELAKAFLRGDFDRLTISYTSYVNVLTQTPASMEILPIVADDKPVEKTGLIIYEPSAEAVFDSIVPQYISGIIYGALCESIASELSARRAAMESANKNADEMISDLSLKYNRARQASITQEITEIVAGSES
ncbi:MAG: ATP synthase F1 subunit gamma [Oscillospiraceae bacterium]|nr:ATP synthase F1 subunit gamma [Oscillospiraceae bacterium]